MNVFTNLKQNETVVLLNCPISAYLHGVKKRLGGVILN